MPVNEPLRELVRTYLTRLAAGEVPVGEAADWALDVMQGDDEELTDRVIWRALDRLAGADLLQAPGEYLHGPEDFAQWLAEFTADSG